MTSTDLEYFEQRVFRPETPCWNWRAYIGKKGYGSWVRADGTRYAHRVAYELLVGPIPDGMEVHHRCFNRSCVNPEHLELTSHAENMSLSAALKTHCKHGHPFSADNTILNRRGHRQCRACRDAWNRAAVKGTRGKSPHCKRGHPRTEEHGHRNASGSWVCRTCIRERQRKPGGYVDRGRPRVTHCKHGHEYTPENTYSYVRDGYECRYCRTCVRERASARRVQAVPTKRRSASS